MIAYDIDGVFIPDSDPSIFKTLVEYLDWRSNQKPSFIPTGDYVMITGRPESDLDWTLSWLDKFFSNKPAKLYHFSTDIRFAKEYKLHVINTDISILKFIESCPIQAQYIIDNLTREVEVVVYDQA